MLRAALWIALAAADRAQWAGRSKLELARSMHDRHYKRAGGFYLAHMIVPSCVRQGAGR